MLLLNPSNQILADTISSRIKGGDEENVEPVKGEVDIRLCDFDDVTYRVRQSAADADHLTLSVSLPFFDQISSSLDELAALYGDTLQAKAEEGENITLKIAADGSNLPCERDEFVRRVGMLRANVVGGVFKKYLSSVSLNKDGDKPAPFKFAMRPDTTVYFVPGDERCAVIYEFAFAERVDQVVCSVFMKEFTESRRRLGAAPPCSFSVNPPQELASFGVTEPSGKSLGFISFSMLEPHTNTADKVDRAAGSLQMFRNFLQYHIKCSKSYFHARMRARVRVLLKVLNRAKQDDDDNKEKRTITGKTFTRK